MKEENGSIIAQTCANLIILPRSVFTSTDESFELFRLAMMAVMDTSAKSFNTV